MIQIGIYDGGTLIHDASPRARGAVMVYGERGPESLRWVEPLPVAEGFQWLQTALRAPEVLIHDGALPIWRGRLEDAALLGEEVEFGALGAWRDLHDVPYTGLWSTQDLKSFRESTREDNIARKPDKFEMQNSSGALFIAPRKNETFGTGDAGAWTYETPDSGERTVVRVEFDWELLGGTSWKLQLRSMTRAFGSITTEWTTTGTGSVASGSQTVSISPGVDRIEFLLFRDATAAAYTGETGDDTYGNITNVRVMSIDQATIEADDLADALLTFADSANSGRLATGTDFVTSPGVDLTELVIEDEMPGAVLVALADGDTAGTRYEVGMRSLDGRVYLRERGSAGRTWLVDLGLPDLMRSVPTLINSAYAVYRDEDRVTRRTATTDDADSIARYGLTRRAAVSSRASDATRAAYDRDAALDGEPEPRARLGVVLVQTEHQCPAGKYEIRSGDTIVPRNLPPWLPAGLSQYLSQFIAARVEYRFDTDELFIEPESPPPDIANQLLKQQERVNRISGGGKSAAELRRG